MTKYYLTIPCHKIFKKIASDTLSEYLIKIKLHSICQELNAKDNLGCSREVRGSRPQTDPHSMYRADKFWTKDVVFTLITLNYSIKNNIGKFRMLSCTVIQLIYSLPLSVVSYLMTLLPGLLSYCVPVPVHLTKPLLLSPWHHHLTLS